MRRRLTCRFCIGKQRRSHGGLPVNTRRNAYALPDDKLIGYYGKLGFSRLPAEQESFVYSHVKPKYDDGCIFMFQPL